MKPESCWLMGVDVAPDRRMRGRMNTLHVIIRTRSPTTTRTIAQPMFRAFA
jgi:hypothetical protein